MEAVKTKVALKASVIMMPECKISVPPFLSVALTTGQAHFAFDRDTSQYATPFGFENDGFYYVNNENFAPAHMPVSM